MDVSIRKNHKLRLKAYDELIQLKKQGVLRKEIIQKINWRYGINLSILYNWYSGKFKPFGRRGAIFFIPELYYVLGALLGDGCPYKWKETHYYSILVGDSKFARKFANKLTICTGKISRAYIDRSKNIWFVRVNNYPLFSMFTQLREDPRYFFEIQKKIGEKKSHLFVEGFFDAEGCVKVVKEKVRKTPKICLDFANTNFEFLEVIRIILLKRFNIIAKYSAQKPNGTTHKKVCYHLRIYKKDFVRTFFKHMSTTKLNPEKATYLKNWLEYKRKVIA